VTANNGDMIPLREFMTLQFNRMEVELSKMRTAVEAVCLDAAEAKRTKQDVQDLDTKTEKLNERVMTNEFKLKVVAGVGTIMQGVGISLAIALLIKLFSL